MTGKKVMVPLDDTNYFKLKQIAKMENRFLCRQAAYWIKRCILEYEQRNGEVQPKSIEKSTLESGRSWEGRSSWVDELGPFKSE